MSLIATIDSAWCYRVWTLQELIFARSAVLVAGRTKITCEVLRMERCHPMQSESLLKFTAMMLRRLNLRSDLGAWTSAPNLFTIMDLAEFLSTSFAISNATDSRDYVYALQGIFGAARLSPPVPNYEKSMAEVFQDMTIAAIESTNRIL